MRRLILVLAMIGVAVVVASGAALGITYGQNDGTKHRGVGALVDRLGAYCSGTLVNGKNGAPVFVTAAHCDDDGKVYVSFDNNYVAERSQFPNGQEVEYPGTLIGDPQWYLRGHDIAVVVFNLGSTPPSTLPKARLPAKGSLNDLPKGQKFTAVGYGVTETGSGEGVRRYAVSSLTSTNSYYLGLSQNIHQGNSGTCNGDSGGPNFLGAGASETNINAALTNTGDAMCKSKNTVLRLDTQAARDFLGRYVALP